MSSVPDVQQALVDLLSAASAFDGVLVRYGPPLKKAEERDRVFVIDPTHYRLGGGEQYRVEDFDLRFIVEVFKAGDDAMAVNRRRWDLINAIDAVLTAADFHGYANEGGTLSTTGDQLFAADEKNYAARSVVSVTYEDRV